MKFCWLGLGLVGACCGSANAQLAVYGKVDVAHFDNNVQKTSAWFVGPGGGVYDDFLHFGPLSAGVDLRGNYLFGSNDKYRSGLAGIRVAAKPPLLPIRPYVQGSVGFAGTKANGTGFYSTASSVSFSHTFGTKFAYQVLGGVDMPILPHIDLRLAEVGYGRVSPVSSNGGSPTSSVLSLSSGVVVRLF